MKKKMTKDQGPMPNQAPMANEAPKTIADAQAEIARLRKRLADHNVLPDVPDSTGVPDIPDCPFCGAAEKYRHGASSAHFILRHKPGCFLGELTVIEEGSEKQRAWCQRA